MQGWPAGAGSVQGQARSIRQNRRRPVSGCYPGPTPEPDVYYPITAYPASGKYRRMYEQEKGKEKAA